MHTGLPLSPEGDGPTGGPACPDPDEYLESEPWVLPEAFESTLGARLLSAGAALACESTLGARGSGARFALGVWGVRSTLGFLHSLALCPFS